MAILVCLSLFPLCPQRFDQENVRELFKLAIQASHQWEDPESSSRSLRLVPAHRFRQVPKNFGCFRFASKYPFTWYTVPGVFLYHGLFSNTQTPTWRRSPLPALPIDVLQHDWWVPGSTSRADSPRYQGKNLFKEILTITMDSCELWMTRATEDWLQKQFSKFCKNNSAGFTAFCHSVQS